MSVQGTERSIRNIYHVFTSNFAKSVDVVHDVTLSRIYNNLRLALENTCWTSYGGLGYLKYSK